MPKRWMASSSDVLPLPFAPTIRFSVGENSNLASLRHLTSCISNCCNCIPYSRIGMITYFRV